MYKKFNSLILHNLRFVVVCQWLKNIMGYGETILDVLRKEAQNKSPPDFSERKVVFEKLQERSLEDTSETWTDELLKFMPTLPQDFLNLLSLVVLDLLQSAKFKMGFLYSYIRAYPSLVEKLSGLGASFLHKMSPQLFHMPPIINPLCLDPKVDLVNTLLKNLKENICSKIALEKNGSVEVDYSLVGEDSEIYRAMIHDVFTVIKVTDNSFF